MDPKDLKKYLAGLGIAGLLTGTSLIAAESPKAEDAHKSAPTGSALKSEPTKTAQVKSS
jgi:radical SAM modification target selenobiotic family peptide